MSHFFTIVIVPGDTEEIESKVTELLAPFSETLKVDPYKVYLSDEDINAMSRHYHEADLHALATYMPDYHCEDGGVDEQGLYKLRTYNPQSKWDWYEIGGRWNGAIRDRFVEEEDGDCYLSDNILPVNTVDHKLHAHAIVTPDGVWHEQGQMGWFALVADKKDADVWDQDIVRLIQKHRDCILVGVDCHI